MTVPTANVRTQVQMRSALNSECPTTQRACLLWLATLSSGAESQPAFSQFVLVLSLFHPQLVRVFRGMGSSMPDRFFL